MASTFALLMGSHTFLFDESISLLLYYTALKRKSIHIFPFFLLHFPKKCGNIIFL